MRVPRFGPKLLTLILITSTSLVQAMPLATKGALLLSEAFEGSFKRHETIKLNDRWSRRVSFGAWTLQADGSLGARNVPEHGHGPVLTYLAPVRNVIIECEFKLPVEEDPDRHFRIFLDHPDYRGHTIQGWANLGTAFRPGGLTLQHISKDQEKTVGMDLEFGQQPLTLRSGQWHKMRLELVDDKARVTVDGIAVQGVHPALNVEKNKIGLNPGKAGGTIRNFKVWEVAP